VNPKVKTTRYERFLVDLSGEKSNQIFDELAIWEEVLKDAALARH
jgi:hypothetical protein